MDLFIFLQNNYLLTFMCVHNAIAMKLNKLNVPKYNCEYKYEI